VRAVDDIGVAGVESPIDGGLHGTDSSASCGFAWAATGTNGFPAGVVWRNPDELNAMLTSATGIHCGGLVSDQLVLWETG